MILPKRLASGWLSAAFFVSMIAAIQPLRAGKTCTVPGTYSDPQSAINDSSCLNIMLGAGTYYGVLNDDNAGVFNISRDVRIIGAGPSMTALDAQTQGTVIKITAGNVRLENMTIQNGAGILSIGGDLTIVNSLITGNYYGVQYGGSGTLTIADSTLSSNDGGNNIGLGVITFFDQTFNLIRSTMTGNKGNGIVELCGQGWPLVNITQSTIQGNEMAIYPVCGTLAINSSTLANNFYGIFWSSAEVKVKGSIFANNNSNCRGIHPDNPAQNGGGNFSWPSADNCPGTVADPKLGPLRNNGGPTLTMVPQSGSTVIGKGTCADTSNNGLAVDQRYRVRPTSGCDPGAVQTTVQSWVEGDANPHALWWRLNEGSGYTAYDSSPHGLNGTVHAAGAPPQWITGSGTPLLTSTTEIYTGAYNTYVSIPDPATTLTDNLALTAWVSCGGCLAYPDDMVIFYNGVYGSNGYGLVIRHSDQHAILHLGSSQFDFGWVMPGDSRWTHLALVRSSGVWYLYANGKSVSEAFNSDIKTPPLVPTHYTTLGADSSGGHVFGGYVTDFRIYDRPLSAGESYQLATATLAGTPVVPGAPAAGTYTIQNVNSGLVLGVASASKSQGANIVQWSNNGSPDQKWTLAPVGNGAYTIPDVNSGMVIGVAGASQSVGTPLIQWPLNTSTDQQWRFKQIGANWIITDVNSGLNLDIQSGSTSAGAQAIQWPGNGAVSQQWALIPVK